MFHPTTPSLSAEDRTFAALHNPTFLQACLRRATPYTPLWLMRQAGRYLPEYKATRAKAGSFMGLATNRTTPPKSRCSRWSATRWTRPFCSATSSPCPTPWAWAVLRRGEGPRFAKTVRTEAAVAELAVPDMDKLQLRVRRVTSIRKALTQDGRVPLIGFSGSPWTLACYMVEGAGSDDYRHVKTLMYSRPDLMHRILAVNADAVAAYLNAQIDAGAQAVMILTAGAACWPTVPSSSSAWPTRHACWRSSSAWAPTARPLPRIVFTKGGGLWLDDMAALDCEVLGLDWTVNLGKARAQVGGPRRPRQGAAGQHRPQRAVCPAAADRPIEVRRVLDSFGTPLPRAAAPAPRTSSTWATASANTPPPEHVAALVETVHAYSRAAP